MPGEHEINAWIAEHREKDVRFESREALADFIAQLGSEGSGKVAATLECGIRPWWQRFLGMSEREYVSLFALEWSDGIAALIFHDDAGSEYRVLDHENPVNAPEAVRLKIAHGEVTPMKRDECMTAERAFRAACENIRTLSRPTWLSYRYVR